MNEEENAIKTLLDKRWFQRLCLAIIIALQVVLIIYWGFQKQGFFIDELWSFGLANSFYNPHLYWGGSLDDTYIYPDLLRSYLVVDAGEGFTFGSVLYNLANDAHPPAYFFLLHSFCSLFPGEFSKWLGILPNILVFIAGQLVLFHLSTKLIDGDWLRFIPVVLWGFSPAAISYSIFVRACLLSCVVVLLLLIPHRRLLVDDDAGWKTCLGLFLFSFLCYMTHYYLFILAFAMACVTVILLLIRKAWKPFFKYCASMIAGLVLTALVFPSAYEHLFYDRYSHNARYGIFDYSLPERIQAFWQDTMPDLFHGSSLYAALVLAFILVCIVIGIARRKKGSGYADHRFGFCFMMFGALIAFVCCAVYASPFQLTRYIVFTYPALILTGTWLVLNGLKGLGGEKAQQVLSKVGLAAVILIVLADLVFMPACIKFLYPEDEGNRQAVAQDEGCQVLYLTEQHYAMVGRILELEQVGVIWPDTTDPEGVAEAVAHITSDRDVLLVYLDSSALDSPENILQSIVDQTSYDAYRHLEGYTVMDASTASGNDGTWSGDFYEVYRSGSAA